MLKIGSYNRLRALRKIDHGMVMGDLKDEENVLLPRGLCPESLNVDDEIDLFVYTDSEDRPVATTETPLAVAGDFAVMTVKDVTPYGAFMEWGLSKDLFVPFKQQPGRFRLGHKYLIKLVLDDLTDRVVGVGKVRAFYNRDLSQCKRGQEVDVLICGYHQLGYKVLVDKQYEGMIYKNEFFEELRLGDVRKGLITKVREEGKLDVSLQKRARDEEADARDLILKKLRENNGRIPYTAKTSAEEVKKHFMMSRKVFKKALGSLYKSATIRFEEDETILIDENSQA